MPPHLLRRLYSVARLLPFIVRYRDNTFAVRFDDVRQVLSEPEIFKVPYGPKLRVILGSEAEFILGMDPSSAYDDQNRRLRSAIHDHDIHTRLPQMAEDSVAELLPDRGIVNIVDVFRRATSKVLLDYYGLGKELRDLEISMVEGWTQLLFEFQFVDFKNDPDLHSSAKLDAAKLQDWIVSRIESHVPGDGDTLLDRYLATTDSNLSLDRAAIRTALIGFVVGGLPQPLIVASNALDELLRRPAALRSARKAAAASDNRGLELIVREAMRFAPLGPALTRVVAKDTTLAPGTLRAKRMKKGEVVFASIASAMLDSRRVKTPTVFEPDRHPSYAMHFGFGHHSCFAEAINHKLIPALIKPILARSKLSRAFKNGYLRRSKNIFPSQLNVSL